MKFDVHVFKENAKDMLHFDNLSKQWEKEGNWYQDQDETVPDSYYPVTADYPYIKKGFKNAIKSFYYHKIAKWASKKINKELITLKVEGKENMKGIKGAIVTCNHISKVDSFAVREVIGNKFKFVATEHNNWKGFLGDVVRNVGYLPIPANLDLAVMRKFNEAVDYYLKKGEKILIYPEQAMWREYKKPRPPKNGAFRYAVKNNVPILPLFITIQDKAEKYDEQGRQNFGDYTVHVLKPIYPQKDKSFKENVEYLRNANYNAWKECYEKTYNMPLEYTTEDQSKLNI